MDSLINVLRDLKKSIEKGLVNYKKSPKDRINKEYIETRLDILEGNWQSFLKNNTKLYEHFTTPEIDNSLYVKDNIYESTEDSYIVFKTCMKTDLNKFISQSKTCNLKDTAQSGSSSSSFVKLPKISIPVFSGKYSEWPTFRDLFTSLVDKNKALDSVQKLHYLKGHLTGEAEQLIRHTPITGANYSQCWELLERRYNNKRYLANCVLKRLFGQKRLNFESASCLKELLDTTSDCLSALRNLNIDVSTWDIIIIHIVTFKLDPETRKNWELNVSSSDSNELPSLKQFSEFIESRFRALECLEPKRPSHHVSTKSLLVTNNPAFRCEFCSESHKLCFCKTFAKQSYDDKREFVIKNKMCFNCLGGNHNIYNCNKPTSCKLCRRRHHSLLHPPSTENTVQSVNKTNSPSTSSSAIVDSPVVSCLSTGKLDKPKQVLLATALINAESRTGNFQVVRALLDQGSQACFITEATVQFLRLKKRSLNGTISGIGENKSVVSKGVVDLVIQSRLDPSCKIPIKAFVLSSITSHLPEKHVHSYDWVELKNLPLADPQFNISNKIDILLGAEIYSYVLREGLKKCPIGSLIAQNTTLGWILSGVISCENSKNNNIGSSHSATNMISMHVQVNEDDSLRKFWEIEEQASTFNKIFTDEEQRCEDFFRTTTRRTKEGRYVVKLPFCNESPECVNHGSREIAETRFKSLEKRLSKNPDLKVKYTAVLDEYLKLGHMRPVCSSSQAVYLPHHAVIREDKSTTKVRVVFNASEKNKKGISLNDTLMVGPTLQADLRYTVLQWRVHPIALVADIIKMYRQVQVADADARYQRILWRNEPENQLQDYELTTVTFGTASAPYLAVKVMHQIAHDEGKNYPLASDKIQTCFYMDDLMTGCSSIEEGMEIYKQIKELLEKGGFQLQKWNSNNSDLKTYIEEKEENKHRTMENMGSIKDNISLLQDNSKDKCEKKMEIKLDSTIKILGLTWNRDDDTFQYSVMLPSPTAPATKRAIISDIAKLFDPLGWIAPTIIIAKTFIQRLWLAGVGWDDKLSSELVQEWNTYRQSLIELTKIRIPRWIQVKHDDVDFELHGFSDASKSAYAAVVYIRTVDRNGKISVTLLNAKTRVAPIKQVSIPRLELCGAVLLSKLLIETAHILRIPKNKLKAWTDSTIVLAWLNSHPSRWKTFIANRTSEILTNMNASQWFHVSTKDNPADLASRGVLPQVLSESKIWFSGPAIINTAVITYKKPTDTDLKQNLEESPGRSHVATTPEQSITDRFSSLPRLLRVIAYCRRMLNKGKNECEFLRKIEIDKALQCCIKQAQIESFFTERSELEQHGIVQLKSSSLKSLSAFIDGNGIIRVGGRLHKADLSENIKHPIVLPKGHRLTYLIIAESHDKTLHGGPQLMANYLRSAYWIISGRNLIKKYYRECVVCAKQRASISHQMMGSLPTVRGTPARPFLHSGVDYAGPISIRTTKGRGYRSYKGYISLFVCMSTRAIHIELVSDMTTQAFLAAFRRFIARRGHCAHLWSDNGTTFVGANKELQQLASIQQSVGQYLEVHGTEWHFIPPRAPNFGGLWEAGVKSVKFHLKRILGDSTLTFEEMSTLLYQIEACLNSRPISVINSDDPNEPTPLTPGHFLIGESLIGVPEMNYDVSSVSCLNRWQFVQKMVQTFWKRWSQEYLSNMVNRYKWRSYIPEPEIGQIVLIKEDDLPPSRWLLGRIIEKHPGPDNITRVVTLRTKVSTMKRPTSKICILPVSK